MFGALLNVILKLRWEDEYFAKVSVTISSPQQFTQGLCHRAVRSHDHPGRSRHVSLRLPAVSSREWARAKSHGQASGQDSGWDHHHPTPASSPAPSELHRPQPSHRPPVRFSKQEKLKADPRHKKVGEFLHYTIIFNMFLLCSVITGEQIRISKKKHTTLSPRRMPQINFL